VNQRYNVTVILRRTLLFGSAGLLAEGKDMQRFGMIGKIVAKEGKRDELLELLLEAGRNAPNMPGCDIYLINISPAEPDAIWVTEYWRSEADHDASLKLESVRAIIGKARPLIASAGESIKFTAVGGLGLPPG
jgi:quinol monooxygenase YgiN